MAAQRYWATFRIKMETRNRLTYQQRRDQLLNVLYYQSANVWDEPTSFVAFVTERGIDTIAKQAKSAIDPLVDVVLIRMTDYSDARYVGIPDRPYEFFANFPDAQLV